MHKVLKSFWKCYTIWIVAYSSHSLQNNIRLMIIVFLFLLFVVVLFRVSFFLSLFSLSRLSSVWKQIGDHAKLHVAWDLIFTVPRATNYTKRNCITSDTLAMANNNRLYLSYYCVRDCIGMFHCILCVHFGEERKKMQLELQHKNREIEKNGATGV